MTVVQRARIPGSDRLVWLVVGEDHLPVEPIRRYLAYLDDVERSPNTLRAYAHHLKLFWDYLDWAELAWTDVGLGQLARFMAWLRRHDPDVLPFGEATIRRRESTINTILAAVNSFYEFHERLGSLPVFERYRFGVRPSNANKPFLHHITKGQPVRTRLVKARSQPSFTTHAGDGGGRSVTWGMHSRPRPTPAVLVARHGDADWTGSG